MCAICGWVCICILRSVYLTRNGYPASRHRSHVLIIHLLSLSCSIYCVCVTCSIYCVCVSPCGRATVKSRNYTRIKVLPFTCVFCTQLLDQSNNYMYKFRIVSFSHSLIADLSFQPLLLFKEIVPIYKVQSTNIYRHVSAYSVHYNT